MNGPSPSPGPALSGSDETDGSSPVNLLIRLLKLGSLINGPMKGEVCDPGDISQIELKVMMALAGEGALAGHELVEIMGVPAMNVSRAIAAMRQRGWVEVAADPDNRRRKPVRLSETGRGKYASLAPSLDTVAEALTGRLTARQARDFAASADVILAAMADWIGSHGDTPSGKG